ncbi:hypothetical protein PILCRDRAFT_815275 [Piloderma croceum F 1598]|uniref:Uncharacterized protein n=1 Tax=Piloderma croceum (strain F 1598) TaxID=765440 RepID=A0A0C3CDC2_PILCF|nr:hypothetical protein PILCRDRAFT_815275 [Piloderma croceum F 1598]
MTDYSLTANVPNVRSASPSPPHRDGQMDSRQNRRYLHQPGKQEEWSSGLDSILDEYADVYSPGDHNLARTH